MQASSRPTQPTSAESKQNRPCLAIHLDKDKTNHESSELCLRFRQSLWDYPVDCDIVYSLSEPMRDKQ